MRSCTPPTSGLTTITKGTGKTEPSLTRDMAFAKAYTDPRNRELVAAECAENQPRLTPVENRTDQGV